MIIAIDPGKNKCGLAVLDAKGNVIEKRILPRKTIKTKLPLYLSRYSSASLVMGASANGYELEKELKGLNLKIEFVSEKNSTLEARKLYWKDNPPQGLLRLIPTTLRVPPVPIDDYAAVVLGKRFQIIPTSI